MDFENKNLHAFCKVILLSDICQSHLAEFARYLLPCGVEYSLIACAIFCKMFQRIGDVNGLSGRDSEEIKCMNNLAHQ